MPLWPWNSSSSSPPSCGQSVNPPLQEPIESIANERPKRTPNRDELADLEFRQLLSQLNDPTTVEDPPAASPGTITSPPSFSAADWERIAAAKKAKEEYESTFPTTMNCLHAFDQVWYCYSLGGQFLNGAYITHNRKIIILTTFPSYSLPLWYPSRLLYPIRRLAFLHADKSLRRDHSASHDPTALQAEGGKIQAGVE